MVPDPFADESPASWLQRTCLFHGVPNALLFEMLSIPCPVDADLELSSDLLRRITAGTGASAGQIYRLGRAFEAIRTRRSPAAALRFSERGQSVYSICPACLASDAIPYLRIAWRFKQWRVCPEHRIAMLDRCRHCHGPFPAMLPAYSSSSGEQDLSFCGLCRESVVGGMPTPTIDERCDIADQIQHQRAWVSAMLNGYFLLDGCDRRLPMGFLFWLVERQGNYADFAVKQERGLACDEKSLVTQSVTRLLHEYLSRSFPVVRMEAIWILQGRRDTPTPGRV